MRNCIVFFLLLCIFPSYSSSEELQAVEAAVALHVNLNRVQNGVNPIYISRALTVSASFYTRIMKNSSPGNAVRHDLMPYGSKLAIIMQSMYEEGETNILLGTTIKEVVGTIKYADLVSIDFLSHIFDSSLPHSIIVYHKDAVAFGWAILHEDDIYYICAHFAIKE